MIVGELFTFAYFYPRNAMLMGDLRDVEAVTRAWREWTTMNHVRNALWVGAVIAQLNALTRLTLVLAPSGR